MKQFCIKSNVQFPQLHKDTDPWGLIIELFVTEIEELALPIGYNYFIEEMRKLIKNQEVFYEQHFALTVEGARDFWKVANQLGMGDMALDIIKKHVEIKLKENHS